MRNPLWGICQTWVIISGLRFYKLSDHVQLTEACEFSQLSWDFRQMVIREATSMKMVRIRTKLVLNSPVSRTGL